MATWRETLIKTLSELGGSAQLKDIYRALPRRKKSLSNYKSTVRNTLQTYNPRSSAFLGTHPTFTRKGRGRWALREMKTTQKVEQRPEA
jgi:uncharacterized protein YjiS (DUF1127 family)